MDACVRLLRTGFEQIVELFVAPEQLLNRKHDVFSGTRPHSLLQCQNCGLGTSVTAHIQNTPATLSP
jgi:hypothetical protein